MDPTNCKNIYKYLEDIQVKCSEYSITHMDSYKRNSKKNSILNILNIIVTAGVATLSSSTLSIEKDTTTFTIINSISISLLFSSTIVNAIQQTLNFEKIAERERTLSIRFVSLGNNIKKFLAIETLQKQDTIEYFKWASNTFEEILTKTSALNIESETISIPVKFQEIDNVNKPESSNSYSGDSLLVRQDNASIRHEVDRFMVNSYNNV